MGSWGSWAEPLGTPAIGDEPRLPATMSPGSMRSVTLGVTTKLGSAGAGGGGNVGGGKSPRVSIVVRASMVRVLIAI